MKIAYNPESADNVINNDTAKSDDIIFDLKAKNIWAKGMRMGTDWADVTSKPSSLPANGGNADTVDTWHKDNIQWTGYITGSASLSSYWFKMYDVTVTSQKYNDITLTFLISEGYTSNFSIFQLRFRQQGDNNSGAYNFIVHLKELVGNCKDKIVAYYNNSTGNIQLWGNVELQWGTMNYTVIKKTYRTSVDFNTLGTLTAQDFTSVQTQPSDGYTKVTMTRVGQVLQAESATSATTATRLQSSKEFWGNDFDGTQDINGTITFPSIGDKATSNKISWSGSTDGADIYYETAAADQGNLVLNVRDDANAYIQLALNGTFKSHFDVANSYWTGRSASADKWNTARNFKIGNSSKTVDGSKDVEWTLEDIGVQNTWRTVKVNSNSINSNPLDLCNGTYVTVTKGDNGKVTFDVNSKISGMYEWYSATTDSSTDKAIDKWFEIVKFLEGIKTDDTLNTLLTNKLSITQISQDSNVNALKNNALYWVDTKSNTGTLTNRPFSSDNYPFAMLSVTNYNESTFSYRSRIAFNDQGQMAVAKCHSESQQDWTDTWYTVLTSNNSGISGSKITINNESIAVSKLDHNHDTIYVKKSGDNMSGTLTINSNTFGSLIINRTNDKDAASITFKGGSTTTSTYGSIGFNASAKDRQLLRWESDTSKVYTILDTSSTYVNKDTKTITINGVSTTWENTWRTIKINGTSIDQNELNLLPGTNVTFSRTNGNVTINSPNTWRSIYVNNTSSSLGSNAMTIANGTNTTARLTNGNTVKINLNSTLTGITDISGGSNDYWRIKFTCTNDDGALEIATADNGTEPIYVRQYNYKDSNSWGTVARTLTLLDGYGNTIVPGILSTTQVKTSGGVLHTGLYTTGYKNSSETDTGKKANAALAYANRFMLLGGGETLEMNIVTKNKTINKTITSLTISESWSKITAISGDTTLTSNGTYIIQAIMDNVYYSGVMSWYTGTPSANNTDEIVLHRGGGGYANTIYLRTEEVQNDKMYLEISANSELKSKTVYFYFQQIC